jgi:hypothetical protein
MSIQVDQKSTIIADTFALPPSPIGLLDIQVFCPDDSIQFWVMLHPTVILLVAVLLVLASYSYTRKVVVILFGIDVHSAVGVPAEGPVHVIVEIIGCGGKRYCRTVPTIRQLFVLLFDEGNGRV